MTRGALKTTNPQRMFLNKISENGGMLIYNDLAGPEIRVAKSLLRLGVIRREIKAIMENGRKCACIALVRADITPARNEDQDAF